MPPVEHRTAGENNGGNIDGGCSHDACRRGLVAARGQDHGVDGIAVQQFHQTEIGEVAVERRGRPAAILEDRMNWKFQGDAPSVANAFTRSLGQIEVDAVARREVTASLGDANDRTARAQFLRSQAVIHESLEIERDHIRARGIGEPVLRAEAAGSLRLIFHRHGFITPSTRSGSPHGLSSATAGGSSEAGSA